jgi:hypothetical protein
MSMIIDDHVDVSVDDDVDMSLITDDDVEMDVTIDDDMHMSLTDDDDDVNMTVDANVGIDVDVAVDLSVIMAGIDREFRQLQQSSPTQTRRERRSGSRNERGH